MKYLVTIIIALFAIPAQGVAQELLNIYCEECRNLAENPEDARNFSYNQVFGPQSWLTMDQADRFRITDNFGNTVTIDMNIDYQTRLIVEQFFDFGRVFTGRIFQAAEIERLLVVGLIVQIRVIYRNLDIVTYRFRRLDVPGELPVGESNTRSSSTGGGTDGGDDDEFNDAADYEYEDTIDDDTECSACTMQPIYGDGTLGDPVDLWTEEEWDEIREL